MPAAPRHPRHVQKGRKPLSSTDTTPQKKAGRPKDAPSTIVNLRIPMDLLAQLDRYIDDCPSGLSAVFRDPCRGSKRAHSWGPDVSRCAECLM
jgi:hypothetical protein